jgi:hypothetical protein
MGTTSLRTRYLHNTYSDLIRERYYLTGVKRGEDVVSFLASSANPFQVTESYRTDRVTKEGVPVELTTQGDKEFLDVTRNGFTEPSPSYDNGHAFFTSKRELTTSHPNWDYSWIDPRNTSQRLRQKGPLFFNVPDLNQSGYYGGGGIPNAAWYCTRLSTGDANKLGARFIANTLPTRSPAQLASLLGESLQMLPQIPGIALLKDNSNFHQSIGGEFLNYSFGIAPTVSDVKDLVNAVLKASKVIKQYHKDSGKTVRRRRSAAPLETVEVTQNVPIPPNNGPRIEGWGDGAIATYGSIQLTRTITTRSWFSGAYSYHLADSEGIIGKMERFEQEANRLLGSRLTPEVLWELSPWSWLADWFANVGDILTNASYLGSDGLVLRYGYLMNHVKIVQKYHMPDGVTFNGGAKSGPIHNTLTFESKERVRATPYGFGTSLSSLSGKQWAILGALGLTRGPSAWF